MLKGKGMLTNTGMPFFFFLVKYWALAGTRL